MIWSSQQQLSSEPQAVSNKQQLLPAMIVCTHRIILLLLWGQLPSEL